MLRAQVEDVLPTVDPGSHKLIHRSVTPVKRQAAGSAAIPLQVRLPAKGVHSQVKEAQVAICVARRDAALLIAE
jgi:hypothetical protein